MCRCSSSSIFMHMCTLAPSGSFVRSFSRQRCCNCINCRRFTSPYRTNEQYIFLPSSFLVAFKYFSLGWYYKLVSFLHFCWKIKSVSIIRNMFGCHIVFLPGKLKTHIFPRSHATLLTKAP